MKTISLLIIGVLLGFAMATLTGPVLAELGNCYEYVGTTSCSSIGGPSRTIIDSGVGMKWYGDSDGTTGTIYDNGPGWTSYQLRPGLKSPC
jgi:hypothetical protein